MNMKEKNANLIAILMHASFISWFAKSLIEKEQVDIPKTKICAVLLKN